MPYREWELDEIARLTKAVELHTRKNRTSWGDVAEFVKTRTPRQCEDRFLNRMKNATRVITKSNNKHVAWTSEEETLLRELVSLHGHKWSLFVDYFPDRDANKIKSKYYNFERVEEPSYDTTQTSGVEESFSWKWPDQMPVAADSHVDEDEEFFTGDFYDEFNE